MIEIVKATGRAKCKGCRIHISKGIACIKEIYWRSIYNWSATDYRHLDCIPRQEGVSFAPNWAYLLRRER